MIEIGRKTARKKSGCSPYPPPPSSQLLSNNIQESRLFTLLVSPQMSDGSEQGPQMVGRLLPWEGQVASGVARERWGQVGMREGRREQAG